MKEFYIFRHDIVALEGWMQTEQVAANRRMRWSMPEIEIDIGRPINKE
jgi:hypothetical protein